MDKLKSLKGKILILSLFLAVFAWMGMIVYKQREQLLRFPWHIHIGYLSLTLLFHSLALGITYFVWHLMMTRIGNFKNPRLDFCFYYLSTLAKRIPTPVWYIGGRLVMYNNIGVSRVIVLNCIALETLFVGLAGTIVYLVAFPFYVYTPKSVVWPVTSMAAGLASLFLIRPQALAEIVSLLSHRLGRGIKLQPIGRQDMLLWTGLYTLPWLFGGMALYYMIRAISRAPGPDLPNAIGVSTLSMLVALLSVILPGGLALKEITVGILLAYWMPLSAGIVISIAYRLLQTLNEIAWALLAYIVFVSNTTGLLGSAD